MDHRESRPPSAASKPIVQRAVLALLVIGLAWSLSASGLVSQLVERLALGAAPGPADGVTRLDPRDVECPRGATARREEATTDRPAFIACEAEIAGRMVRDGPYLELDPEGMTARQGAYARGAQVGRWVRWTPAGEIDSVIVLKKGEASRFIPEPEDLCPPGATRRRDIGFDDRRRMWSSCTAPRAGARPELNGPYVTWDEEHAPGGARYVLRDITTYAHGERHGTHLEFAGPFQHESLVEEETYEHGALARESRGYYDDGAPRELRHYLHGQLDGERVGYGPDGSERWRVTYDHGQQVAVSGDLRVAERPCPAGAVPTFAPDRHSASCASRNQGRVQRDGPYVVWDTAGQVVESGLYANNEKKELWTAPPGVELPATVSDQTLVATIPVRIGEEEYALEAASRQPAKGRDGPVSIWFRDNVSARYPTPRTVIRSSAVEVYGLPPGNYYMEIDVDANKDNPMRWPGDLTTGLDFAVAAGELTRGPTAKLMYTMHLLAPWDNGQPIPGFRYPCTDAKAVIGSPVRFAWERPPVDPRLDLEYRYGLARRECQGYRMIETKLGATKATEVLLDLPPSRPGEAYQWNVVAFAAEKPVGRLMAFGDDGSYGWSLSFRVR
jgi:antitoxin component YwqK of YwqJK toxin-antitoxin module